jgi:hypothetical protein
MSFFAAWLLAMVMLFVVLSSLGLLVGFILWLEEEFDIDPGWVLGFIMVAAMSVFMANSIKEHYDAQHPQPKPPVEVVQ